MTIQEEGRSQLKKNESKKYFFAAVGVAVIVFICVGIIMLNYSMEVKDELYNTSSNNLNQVYTQVCEKFMQITNQQWKLLGMTGDFIEEADGNIDDIRQFLDEWKDQWHYTEFYFIDDDCNYMSSTGNIGYLELGSEWRSLVLDRENIVVDGSLPGSDEVMFFAIPVEPADIGGFTYNSIAVSYDTDSVNRELGVKAFAHNTSSYIVYNNGDIVLKSDGSADIGGNIFYHLRNASIPGKSLEGFMKSVKAGESGNMYFQLDDEGYYLVYVPVGFKDWGLISMVPVDVANVGLVSIQQRTVLMTVHIGALLLIVATVVLYTYYKRYASVKNHEIARRDMLFSIMGKNLDDVYIMLSWGDWEKLYVSTNVERVLGIKNDDTANLAVDFRYLEKKGEVPEWNNITNLKKGESAVNEYWIKPAGACEYRLFKQGSYHMDKDGDDVLVIILSDITYEQQIRGHIEDALHTAEAANLAKSQFLSNMSHDIRTPMNAIVGFSQLLLRNEKKPEKVKKYAQNIVVSSHHLLSLINDVLDMSKIESGKTTLNISDVDIADIVLEIDNIIRPQASQKNQTFTVCSENVKHECIKADKLRLNQILLNILSNAVKYTQYGGRIIFDINEISTIGRQFAQYSFTITDNGIGMSKEYINDIFKPFSREENGYTENIQGTGLGMAITKNLIDLMGGTIRIDSEPGKGSVFEVTMEFVISEKNKDMCNAIAGYFDREDVDKAGTDRVFEGKHFLLAEDNIINIEMMCEFFESEGAECSCVRDGKSVVAAFNNSSEGQYDMIFMDVQMPELDGCEAARTIRDMERPDAKTIPIIAMTANAFSNDVKAVLNSGMNAHLIKPIDPEQVKDVVRDFT